ncbi:MAG: aldo/keto reductase [Cyanobacteria bacterium J06634_5]
MDYRTLGKTGLQVSPVGIGSWQLSGPLSLNGKADGFPELGRGQVIELIRGCGELGINFIDTAPIYGDGEGESRIGEAIRGQRDQWIVSSKFGMWRGERGERVVNTHPSAIRPTLEGSLRRLQTDYVDVYLYHSPPEGHLIVEGQQVLEALKREGKLRFYGISTDDPKVLAQLADQQAVDVAMFAQSLLKHPAPMLKLVKDHNLGVIVRGSLAAGQLSGKYFDQPPRLSEQDIRTGVAYAWKRYGVYKKFLPAGGSMTAFALRYLLDFETTHTIILGGKSIENYQTALAALALPPLGAETHRALTQVRRTLSIKNRGSRAIRRLGRPLKRLVGAELF